MAIFKGGSVADDQADIERRVLATMERTYHCAYCHTVMRGDRCISCGSTKKLCNSCHNSDLKTHGTIDGGDR